MNIIIKDIHVTATALLTACFVSCLPNTSVFSLFRTEANADATSTAKVTVFIPPAVPTGEPPINIKSKQTNADALVRFSCGTVAKPAVLVVTD